MMTDTFKVAKIINEFQIVVNAGVGMVEIGDTLEVFEEDLDKVIDPDTKTILGTLDYVKASVKVIRVLQNMCICKSDSFTSVFANSDLGLSAFSPKMKPLKVDLKEVTGDFEDVDSTIRIGDLVRKAL